MNVLPLLLSVYIAPFPTRGHYIYHSTRHSNRTNEAGTKLKEKMIAIEVITFIPTSMFDKSCKIFVQLHAAAHQCTSSGDWSWSRFRISFDRHPPALTNAKSRCLWHLRKTRQRPSLCYRTKPKIFIRMNEMCLLLFSEQLPRILSAKLVLMFVIWLFTPNSIPPYLKFPA